MKNLLIRTITGIFIVILIVGCVVLGEFSFLLLLEIILLLGMRELAKMLSAKSDLKNILLLLSGMSLLAFTYLIITNALAPLWIILPFALFILPMILSIVNIKRSAITNLRYNLLGFFWLSLPLSLFLALGWAENSGAYHYTLPLIIISLLWVNDSSAYLIGSLIGKHKMTPIISPGKTWEGFFGGMIITILISILVFRITNSYTPWIWIILSATTVIFGFLGDITESKIKRVYKVKNSGNLLPGHGGILDRFDSLLIASPAVFIVLLIINFIK